MPPPPPLLLLVLMQLPPSPPTSHLQLIEFQYQLTDRYYHRIRYTHTLHIHAFESVPGPEPSALNPLLSIYLVSFIQSFYFEYNSAESERARARATSARPGRIHVMHMDLYRTIDLSLPRKTPDVASSFQRFKFLPLAAQYVEYITLGQAGRSGGAGARGEWRDQRRHSHYLPTAVLPSVGVRTGVGRTAGRSAVSVFADERIR